MASRANLRVVALLAIAALCRCAGDAPTRDMLGCGDDANCYDSQEALATTKSLCHEHAELADGAAASSVYKECLAALLPERFKTQPRKTGKGFGGPADACKPRYNFDVECGHKHPTREMLHCRDDECYARADTVAKAQFLCAAYETRRVSAEFSFLSQPVYDMCMLHVLPEKRTPLWNTLVRLARLLAGVVGW